MREAVPDTVVVGGGIIGASIAWRLAEAGKRVTVFEAGAWGGEASWAGAGMLAPGGEVEKASPWSDFARESRALYPAYVAALEQASGLNTDFQPLGAFELAFSPSELETIQARALRQQALGVPSERVDAAAMRSEAPLLSDAVLGGLFYPGDALIDPRRVLAALRVACERAGCRIVEHTPVERIRARGKDVTVEAAGQTCSASEAVVAAGAWSSSIHLEIDGLFTPLEAALPARGHLIGYELAPGSLGPILRRGHTYVLQRENGFTITGASVELAGWDREIDPATVTEIVERAARVAPLLGSLPVQTAWTGFRPATASGGICLGRLEESAIWLAYGHYRNGILLAPATAGRMRDALCAGSPLSATLGRD